MLAKVADLDKNGSIDFNEFLEIVGPAGSTNKAVKNALLGPASRDRRHTAPMYTIFNSTYPVEHIHHSLFVLEIVLLQLVSEYS
jgi:hypothetical protein